MKRTISKWQPTGLLTILLTTSIFAQVRVADFEGRQTAGLAANRPERTLTLEIEGGERPFRVGETIPLTLIYQTPGEGYYSPGRISRGPSSDRNRFVLEQSSEVIDPILRYRTLLESQGMGFGGGVGGMATSARIEVITDLNQWVRFIHPGRYRLFVESGLFNTGTPHPAGDLTSNILDLEILAADPEWQRKTLEDSLGAVRSDDPIKRERGCRALRHLDTRRSLEAILDLWPSTDQFSCRDLFRAVVESDLSFVETVKQMDARMADPAYPVSPGFVDAHAHARLLAHLNSVQRGMLQTARYESATELLRLIPLKTGDARRQSLFTVLQWDEQLRRGGTPFLERKQAEVLARDLATHFSLFPPSRQQELLSRYWGSIRHEAFVGPLVSLFQSRYVGDDLRPLFHLAAIRLEELAPEVFRQIIRQEILTGKRRLSRETLSLLPDSFLPEFEQELTDQLIAISERARPEPDEWEHLAALLARFAGPSVAAKIRFYFKDKMGQLPCSVEAPILAYFLKNDQASGATLTRQALSRREPLGLRCYAQLLERLLKIGMAAAVLTSVARDYVKDPDPGVEAGAVELISQMGSPDSATRLWELLDAEPPPTEEQTGNLSRGLLHARHWTLTSEELIRLGQYCLTTECEEEIARAIQRWQHPALTIKPFSHNGRGVTILHYWDIPLEKALEKIDQFPTGTKLRMPECSGLHFSIREDCQQMRGRALERGLVIG